MKTRKRKEKGTQGRKDKKLRGETEFFLENSVSLHDSLEPVLKVKRSSLEKCSHVAPLGLRLFVCSVFYKHVAPLGL